MSLHQNKKFFMITMILCLAFHFTDMMVFYPISPHIIKEFGLSNSAYSLLVTAYTLAAFLSGLALFLLKWSKSNRALFAGTILGLAVSTLFASAAASYESLLVARILSGFFGGMINTLTISAVSDAFPEEQRGASLGKLMMAFAATVVVGVPTGIYLSNISSWHMTFTILGFLGLALTPLSFLLIAPQGTLSVSTAPRRHAVLNAKSSLFLLFYGLLIFGQFAIIPFISPALIFNIKISLNQLPWVYLIGGSAAIFAAPLAGKLCDRIGILKVVSFGIVAFSLMTYAITNSGALPFLIVVPLAILFFTSVSARTVPATTALSLAVGPEERLSYLSLSTSIQHLAGALASALAGAIILRQEDQTLLNFDTVGYIAIASSLASWFLFFYLSRKYLLKAETSPN